MRLKKNLLFLFIFLVTVCSMYLMINAFSSKKKKNLKEREFKGIIKKKRIKKEETFYIKIDDGDIQITAVNWGYREMKFYSWDYAEVGDSIIKPKDQLRIIIKKKDGTSKSFPYLY